MQVLKKIHPAATAAGTDLWREAGEDQTEQKETATPRANTKVTKENGGGHGKAREQGTGKNRVIGSKANPRSFDFAREVK
jgi:hypothetical protein